MKQLSLNQFNQLLTGNAVKPRLKQELRLVTSNERLHKLLEQLVRVLKAQPIEMSVQ
jgi:hypothetical protein